MLKKNAFVLLLLCFGLVGCSGQPAPDASTYKPGDPQYEDKLNDPGIQNAQPANPLTKSQLDYFITIEELQSLSDSSYEWEPANDLFSNNSLILSDYACDYAFDFGYQDIQTRTYTPSPFGPFLVEQIRKPSGIHATKIIESLKKDLPNCVKKSPIIRTDRENRHDIFELVEMPKTQDAVLWKLTYEHANPADSPDTVTYVGFLAKDEILIDFFWGLAPIASDYATEDIIVKIIEHTAAKKIGL